MPIPDEVRIAGFVRRALSEMPGVGDVHVQLDGHTTPPNPRMAALLANCEHELPQAAAQGALHGTGDELQCFPIEAAGQRLRAIVMTSLAFGLGCVPLAIASGPGANSLRAIGTGVIGGIIASTLIGVLFAPFFFWLLESASRRFARRADAGSAPSGAQAH